MYLTPDDYAKLAGQNSVEVELIEDEGESRYKLTDIIGKDLSTTIIITFLSSWLLICRSAVNVVTLFLLWERGFGFANELVSVLASLTKLLLLF